MADPLLPGLIADDLLADRESPVAPMLAILLTDMWDAAKSAQLRPVRSFDDDLYHEFRSRGLSLDDFLGRQLQALHGKQPEVVDSGLALDLLAYHTTPLGTAEQRTDGRPGTDLPASQGRAAGPGAGVPRPLPAGGPIQEPARSATASRLAHDTLAPHVRKRFDESDAPASARDGFWRAGRWIGR